MKQNTKYYYQATCKSLGKNPNSTAAGRVSSFTTASDAAKAESVRFVWAADLGGQGWGRNPNLAITHVDSDLIEGGNVIFDSMKKTKPDFALFQGDMIYADGRIPTSKEIPADVGGGIWTNNFAKDFVAITLDEFRTNWKYNLGDEKMSGSLAETPVYVQWDDHEVTNNGIPVKLCLQVSLILEFQQMS